MVAFHFYQCCVPCQMDPVDIISVKWPLRHDSVYETTECEYLLKIKPNEQCLHLLK